MLSRDVAILTLEDAEDAGEPRDAGVSPSGFQKQAAGAPGSTLISLHQPSRKTILAAAGFWGGAGEENFF